MDEHSLTNKDILILHDKRLGEQDQKINDTQKSNQAIEHELRQLIERINMGVSPTQQKILEKSGDIEKQIMGLDHKLDMALRETKDYVEKEVATVTVRLQEHDDFMRNFKTALIWSVLIAVLTTGSLAIFNMVRGTLTIQTTRTHEKR